MDVSPRPWYQTGALMVFAAISGFLFLGNVLNAAANALTFVSPRVTYVGTVVLAAIMVAAQLLLIHRPLPWIVGGRVVVVKRLRRGSVVSVFGMIVLLWIPRVLQLPHSPAIPVLQLQVLDAGAPRVLVGNPTDHPVNNARVSATLWNVDADPILPPINKSLSAPVGERLVAKIQYSDEVAWIPRHAYYSLVPLDLAAWGIRPGNRVMGWFSISCMDCVGVETFFVYFKAGKIGMYGHFDGKIPLESTAEAAAQKVLSCQSCPLSSFFRGPSNFPPVKWTLFR